MRKRDNGAYTGDRIFLAKMYGIKVEKWNEVLEEIREKYMPEE